MPSPELSVDEPTPAEPALPAGSSNLPVPAQNLLPAITTDESLTEQLIRLLATSYVRRKGRFFHVDRPTDALARDDLQRAFITQAAARNSGKEIPKDVMKKGKHPRKAVDAPY